MAENRRLENLIFENVDGKNLMWKNFRGKVSEFNTDGKRSFHLVLDPEYAQTLAELGWNIKWPKEDQNPDGTLNPLLPVFLRFDVVPPNIWLINGKSRLKLDEESVNELDYAYITQFDLNVSPYRWEFGGKTGIKAYVKSMAVHIQQDPIEAKYSAYADLNGESMDDEVPFD